MEQFARHSHGGPDYRVSLPILFSICVNLRHLVQPTPTNPTCELKGVHHAN